MVGGRAMLTVVVLAATSTLVAEGIENRRLTWDDFKGAPDVASPFDAYTYWSVRYSYDTLERTAEGWRLRFHVWNRLGDRSWVKRDPTREAQLAELLNHEQGHYSLGVICALSFKKAVASYPFTTNYRAEASRLFGETLERVLALEKAYDTETRHMHDRAQQKAWDAKLARMIEELWPYR